MTEPVELDRGVLPEQVESLIRENLELAYRGKTRFSMTPEFVDWLVQRHDKMREALRRIECGWPAGSTESTLASDGTWREYARDLQRVARVALR